MARLIGKECEFKKCTNKVGPGSAKIGFVIDGKPGEVLACEYHTHLIRTAPRNTWRISADKELIPIPAHPLIIT